MHKKNIPTISIVFWSSIFDDIVKNKITNDEEKSQKLQANLWRIKSQMSQNHYLCRWMKFKTMLPAYHLKFKTMFMFNLNDVNESMHDIENEI